MAAFDEFIAAGVDLCFFGTLDETGILKGGTATAPAAGAAAGSAMGRLKGMQNADVGIPQPDQVNIPGDNRTQGSFLFPSEETPGFTMTQGVFQMLLHQLEQGTIPLVRSGLTMSALAPVDYTPEDMCFILQSPSKKKNTGVSGLKGWTGYIIPVSQAFPMGKDAFATRAGAADRQQVIANAADKLPDGTLIDATNFSTAGAAIIEFSNDYPIYFQRFTGNAILTAFTLALAAAVNSAAGIQVTVGGVLMVYTTDFTVSGTTLTFAVAPASGAKIVATVGFTP